MVKDQSNFRWVLSSSSTKVDMAWYDPRASMPEGASSGLTARRGVSVSCSPLTWREAELRAYISSHRLVCPSYSAGNSPTKADDISTVFQRQLSDINLPASPGPCPR
jgi:hypothetical protein